LTVLFKGEWVLGTEVPWSYLPTWYGITTPVVVQLAFVGGLIWTVARWRRLTDMQFICITFLLFQAFALPTFALLAGSTVYDGLRQFLFVFPSVAVLASVFFVWLYRSLPRVSVRFGLLVLVTVLAARTYGEMIALHPYEYIYFNELVGGLKGADGRYETDYWGLSMREGMEWINREAGGREATVVSGFGPHSAKAFSAPNIEVLDGQRLEDVKVTGPFFYIAPPRWDLREKFPRCEIAYEVRRRAVPLTRVKRCPTPPSRLRALQRKRSNS
jgi:hypothetical protein